ncbi:hypothetical protein CGRA01v4_10808 [Colletotrichum graminicola]|nr:hypothetical protein CGRA01v4_10808 [Colletotrichum graminicola]
MQQTALPMHGKLGTPGAQTMKCPHRGTKATSQSSAGLGSSTLHTYCFTHTVGFSWLPLRQAPGVIDSLLAPEPSMGTR